MVDARVGVVSGVVGGRRHCSGLHCGVNLGDCVEILDAQVG